MARWWRSRREMRRTVVARFEMERHSRRMASPSFMICALWGDRVEVSVGVGRVTQIPYSFFLLMINHHFIRLIVHLLLLHHTHSQARASH